MRYPKDRYDGHVALTDKDGKMYVPEFTDGKTETVGSSLKYARAFLVLARRFHRYRSKNNHLRKEGA